MSKVTKNQIENLIYIIRNQRVMLDSDLAVLYGVETKVLNQAVSRNKARFPKDFAFKLTKSEWDFLKSQIVTSKLGRGGRRKLPYVFTEQGVAMLSGVLKSQIAVKANIEIMRTFVNLRNLASTYKELEQRIAKLEKNTDKNYKLLLEALMQ
jgi:hypothetical protein